MKTSIVHACVAAVLAVVPAAVTAKSARNLSDLVGARASGAERDLEARGWVHITGHKGANSSYTYWWNGSRKDCVMATTRDGRYAAITDASAGDCNQRSGNGGNDAAVGAVAAGAVIAAVLLAHKSGHHDNGRHYDDSRQEADYERGYRDGLHNSYRDDRRSDSYASGYRSGVDQRQREIDHDRNDYARSSYNAGNFSGSRGRNYGSDVADVSDLVGSKAAGVESDLQARGFRSVDGFQSGSNGRGTIWWNARTRQCLQMITADGRADSITDIQTHRRCR